MIILWMETVKAMVMTIVLTVEGNSNVVFKSLQIELIFYPTQVSDLWVWMSLTHWPCWDLTDATQCQLIVSIGQSKSDNPSDATWKSTLEPMHVAPSDDQILNQCMYRHLVLIEINLNFCPEKDFSSYGLNTLGPLCLWQCFDINVCSLT